MTNYDLLSISLTPLLEFIFSIFIVTNHNLPSKHVMKKALSIGSLKKQKRIPRWIKTRQFGWVRMALTFTFNIQTRENYSYQPTKGGCKNENLAKQLSNKSAHVNTQMCTIVWKEYFSSLSIHVLNLLEVQTVARNLHWLCQKRLEQRE